MSSGPPWGLGRRKPGPEIKPADAFRSGNHASDELTVADAEVRRASTMPRQLARVRARSEQRLEKRYGPGGGSVPRVARNVLQQPPHVGAADRGCKAGLGVSGSSSSKSIHNVPPR